MLARLVTFKPGTKKIFACSVGLGRPRVVGSCLIAPPGLPLSNAEFQLVRRLPAVEKENFFAMLAPPSSSLSQFVDAYHLWSLVIPLFLLGAYHLMDLAAHLWFRSLGNINEAYYAYKARCLENRRRYEQVADHPVRPLSRGAGAD